MVTIKANPKVEFPVGTAITARVTLAGPVTEDAASAGIPDKAELALAAMICPICEARRKKEAARVKRWRERKVKG